MRMCMSLCCPGTQERMGKGVSRGDGVGSSCLSSCLAFARASAGVGGLHLARARAQVCLGKASGDTHLLHPTEHPQALPPGWHQPRGKQVPGVLRRGSQAGKRHFRCNSRSVKILPM